MVTVSRNERGIFTLSKLRTPTSPPTSSDPSLRIGVRSRSTSDCARKRGSVALLPLYWVVMLNARIAVSGDGSYVSRGTRLSEFTLGATKRSAAEEADVMRMPMRRRWGPLM